MAKHKRTRATDITKQVKMEVALRDNGRCIICGGYGIPNAHFIKRSQGGLGIPENIVSLCPRCHFEQDFGKNTKDYTDKIENYLRTYYGDTWNKEKLVYRKY